MVDSNEMQRTTRNSVPQDGFDCIYLCEDGVEVGCLNGPQNDPRVIDRAKHWERAAANQSDVEALAATTAERPGTVTSEPEPSTSATPPAPTPSAARIAKIVRDQLVSLDLGLGDDVNIHDAIAILREDADVGDAVVLIADVSTWIADAILALLPDVAAIRAAAFDEAAKKVEPVGPRPCDCEYCDCGNHGDARAVAAWDTMTDLAAAIRAAGEK